MTPELHKQYELAALAAGIELEWSKGYPNVCYVNGISWVPLHDNADSFCLMVKCSMEVSVCENGVMATQDRKNVVTLNNEFDSIAATRQAIFLAAVEIGRKMKEEGGRKMSIILENNNGVLILDTDKDNGHFKAHNALCECGMELIVAPKIFRADHKIGDPVMVCDDHGVHRYRFNNLVIGQQPKGTAQIYAKEEGK